MIIGHGIDVVEISDLRRWVDDPRNPFLSRCFTDVELAAVGDNDAKYETLAGRFAAKEAVLKALGTGFGAGVSFKDVEIIRDAGRPPEVVLRGGALVSAQSLGIGRWLLSISHSRTVAFASAVATP